MLKLKEWRRDERGVSAVEFAGALPMLLILMLFITELGRAYIQANTIEKGLRTCGLYAARADLNAAGTDLPASTRLRCVSLMRTGTLNNSGNFLVPGWETPALINLIVEARVHEGAPLNVITLDVSVPFAPLFPGLMNFLGMTGDTFMINLKHEQPYLGS